MRTVQPSFLDHPVSALGFGCASLGSRVSAAAGIAAVERALAAGVTWFDVAPSYGEGEAEALLGHALSAQRGPVAVVSKVGLDARASGARRIAARLLRPLLAQAPGLRPLIKRFRPPAARRLTLTPDLIRESALRSRDRLRVERLAVLALHEPSIADVVDPAVMTALVRLRDDGVCAAIGIAGDLDVFVAARAAGAPVTVLQTAGSVLDRLDVRLDALPPELRPDFVVTHSVFGVDGALSALRRLPPTAFEGGVGADQAALGAAFAINPNGVVLASSFRPEHLTRNVATAMRPPDVAAARRLAALLGGDGVRSVGERGDQTVGEAQAQGDGEERRVRLA